MKTKLIVIILILFFTQSFAQDNKKHPFAVDFGITYHHVNKKNNYFRPDSLLPRLGVLQVTRNPGLYSYSTIALHAEINKNFKIVKNIYIRTGLTFYNDKQKFSTPADTITKYYRFTDSIKQQLPFEIANWPLESCNSLNSMKITVALLYNYKRFSFIGGFKINTIDISYNKSFYDNKIVNSIEVTYLNQENNLFSLYGTLQFQILKTLPLLIYISSYNNLLLGFEYQFSEVSEL